MRTTSSISFYCRKSKTNKKGFAPIEVSVIINGKRTFFNLPRKERPEDFEKQSRKRTSDLNRYLDQIRTNLNEAQTGLITQGMAVTTDRIKEYLRTGGIRTYTLECMFEDYLSMLKERVGVDLAEETYKKYIIVREEFFRYVDSHMEASAVNSSIISNFYVHLNKTNKTSTSASKMTKLKTIFRFAFDAGKIQSFPFSTIRIKRAAPLIEFLTPSEMNKIATKRFQTERLERIRDLIIFQASSGLSYADMANLKPGDLQETEDGTFFIKKDRIKTGVSFTAVVLPRGVEVYRKYNGSLPVVSNQRYNEYIGEIAELCGIKKACHSHIFRKTYATMMLNKGINITTVSKLLGHTNSKITEKHYAKTLDETIFAEVAQHIG